MTQSIPFGNLIEYPAVLFELPFDTILNILWTSSDSRRQFTTDASFYHAVAPVPLLNY